MQDSTANSPRSNASRDPAPGDKKRLAIVVLVCWGFLFSLFYRVSVAVISPQLTTDLGLTSVNLGDLAAIFFYAFALVQIPLGMALDRWGTRYIISGLGFLAVVGSVLFGLSQTYNQAWWGRALMGLGMSCNLMGGFTLFSAWFPINRFAFLTGILTAVGTFGNLMAATPLALLTQWLGWRYSFLAVAGLNLIQVVLLFLVVRDRPPGAAVPAKDAEPPWRGAGRLLKTYFFWAISLSTFARYGYFVAIQGLWAAPYLVFGLKMGQVPAANVILCLGIGVIVGMPVFGRISDTLVKSRKKVVFPALGLYSLCCFFMLIWQEDWPTYLLYVVFFLIGMASGPGQILYAHVKELVPENMAARAMTGVNVFTMLGGAVFTQILGFAVGGDPAKFTSVDDFSPIWWVGGIALGIASVLYYFTPESSQIEE